MKYFIVLFGAAALIFSAPAVAMEQSKKHSRDGEKDERQAKKPRIDDQMGQKLNPLVLLAQMASNQQQELNTAENKPRNISKIIEHLQELGRCALEKNKSQETVETDILKVAQDGDVLTLKNLLSNANCNVMARDRELNTALHKAAIKGHVAIIELLLQHGLDKEIKNDNGETPLLVAAEAGQLEVVKFLIQQGAQFEIPDLEHGSTPLHWAVYQGHIAVVECLLAVGANVHVYDKHEKKTPLHEAAFRGYPEIIKLLAKAGAKLESKNIEHSTALITASYYGNTTAVQALIEVGANINAVDDGFGGTALYWATERDYPEIAKLLIKNKARLDICNKEGVTPLMLAQTLNNKPLIQILTEAEIQAQLRLAPGETLLHMAAKTNNRRAASQEIKNKTPLESNNKNKEKPLHVAAYSGSSDVTQLLLLANANVDAIDKNGCTPLEMAVLKSKNYVMVLLLAFGAKFPFKTPKHVIESLLYTQGFNSALTLEIMLDNSSHVKTILDTNLLTEQDFNQQDIIGMTPLMWAVARNNEELVNLLLNYAKVHSIAINIDLTNKFGQTAVKIAKSRKLNKIAKMLTNKE